jgi:hypothetical protein
MFWKNMLPLFFSVESQEGTGEGERKGKMAAVSGPCPNKLMENQHHEISFT